MGGGRVPYDVNVALVPAALDAAARLWASGPIGPDSERAADARALAAAWGTTARHFAVEIDGETARERLAAFIADRGLPGGDNAAQAIGDVIRFPAIALDAELNPIPVMHGDDCLAMLFTNPAASALDGMAQRIADPFPAGLRVPNAGIVVANPAFAPANVQGLFTAGHYHGTVAWSWPHAAYAAGLGLYALVRNATQLPVGMDTTRALTVFTMILVMCMASAALAMRRLADADPAEIF
mgnify:CR=1 FL=1